MKKITYSLVAMLLLITSLHSYGQTPQEMLDGFKIGMKRTECEKLLKAKYDEGILKARTKTNPIRIASEDFERSLEFHNKTYTLQLRLAFRYKAKGAMNSLFLDKIEIFLVDADKSNKSGTGYFSDENSFAVNRGLQEELKEILVEELDKRGWKYSDITTRQVDSGKNSYATVLEEIDQKKEDLRNLIKSKMK